MGLVVHPWYAVKRRVPDDVASWAGKPGEFKYGAFVWLQDTCAGGSYDVGFGNAVWYHTAEEARDALDAAEIPREEHTLVLVRENPAGAPPAYVHEDVPWP